MDNVAADTAKGVDAADAMPAHLQKQPRPRPEPRVDLEDVDLRRRQWRQLRLWMRIHGGRYKAEG